MNALLGRFLRLLLFGLAVVVLSDFAGSAQLWAGPLLPCSSTAPGSHGIRSQVPCKS
jgi:hypothetical protein